MNFWSPARFAHHLAGGLIPIDCTHPYLPSSRAGSCTAQPSHHCLTERASGSVRCKGLFLTSKTPLFMQGLNTGHTDASPSPSDLTFNIPKPFITRHPYPALKSPSHKANNLVVHFSVLLYVSDCLSPSVYSTASISFPSYPNLCRSPRCHHCVPTIPLGLPHPSMSIRVSPSIPPQFSSAI